jgi:hypothetical protein
VRSFKAPTFTALVRAVGGPVEIVGDPPAGKPGMPRPYLNGTAECDHSPCDAPCAKANRILPRRREARRQAAPGESREISHRFRDGLP